jgi:hypothetical protein
MYEQRADRPEPEQRTNLVDSSTLQRSAPVSTWTTRVSWGSIFAAAFVVIAVQLALSALGIWGNFGLAKLTSISALQSSATSVAIWIGVSAVISLFVGGIVAVRLSNSRSVRSALWHGLIVWGISVTAMTVLSTLGIAGMLGFGLNSSAAAKAVVGATGTAGAGLTRATSAAAKYGGYYLLFSAIGVIGALAGGWVGSMGMSRRASTGVSQSTAHQEETETVTRRAA